MKNLELLHFEQLKNEIETQFLTRHTPSQDRISQWKGIDIIYFQEDLREITKGTISEKSFYTYFKAKNLEKIPRIDMLNILSQYVGYASWHEFKKKHLFENEELPKNPEEIQIHPEQDDTSDGTLTKISSDQLGDLPTDSPEKSAEESKFSSFSDENLPIDDSSDPKTKWAQDESSSSSKYSESLSSPGGSSSLKIEGFNQEIDMVESLHDPLKNQIESSAIDDVPSERSVLPSSGSQAASKTAEVPSQSTIDPPKDEGFALAPENPGLPTSKNIKRERVSTEIFNQPEPTVLHKSKKWLWWGLGTLIMALSGLGVYLSMPTKYAYVFRDADRGTNVQVAVLVKVNKPGESPIYYRLRPGEPFVYETREHSLNMEVSSPLYENITLTRNLDNAPDTEYILLRPDDYKAAVYYYSKKNIALDSEHAVEQLTEKRRELNRRISDDAQIYQVFDNDIYGIESLTKDQYITLVTTPTTSLKNLSFIDVKSKNGKIISIKFKINENEKHP